MQNSLRPLSFDKFIGQDRIKQTVKVIIDSSVKRKKPFDHMLFYGSPGLGKTTLADIIAKYSGRDIVHAQGPLLEKKADILTTFASIKKGDVLFIDEIHSITKVIEELLYSAMEDGVLDVLIGPEGDQKIMRMKLPSFSLIGATTKYSRVSKPLRDRFGFIGKLRNYSIEELTMILENSSKLLKIDIGSKSLKMISAHSKQTPRVANNLLKRCNDFAVVRGIKKINETIVKETFESIGLYEYGLNDSHINYMISLYNSFGYKYVSLETISGLLDDEKVNLEREIEPLLLSKSLISKSSKGRALTMGATEYLRKHKFLDNV
ncbi:MAG: Holliday junction branch migration DNA helicase RuvB [Mycoplasmataceae bacterium]|nr:Holliday junction branch migration DNA helicase RuvB [Mycoplasmataceae bacterium]